MTFLERRSDGIRKTEASSSPGPTTPAEELRPAPHEIPVADKHSYAQIMKSTLLIGGASIVNVFFSILRNKAIAVTLGADGVGLFSLYNSILDLAHAVSGLGVQSSGIRQVAEASGMAQLNRIARIARILKWVSFLLGLVGALLVAATALQISNWTFGNDQHRLAIVVLAVAVLLRVAAGGQMALIEGTRRIASLTRITILTAIGGTMATVALVSLFGARGLAPSLVAIAAVTLVVSWWYNKKILLPPAVMSRRDLQHEAGALLKLGFVFMTSSLLAFGTAYAIRIVVLQHGGVAMAGLYQAAWALGGLYAGLVLQAMGTDFYPRLTATSRDNALWNRLANEQTKISILLAGPGIIATITFAPFVTNLFYSGEFFAAGDLLRWICLGMVMRIVAWPMGYIILAKGARTFFLISEAAAAVVQVGLTWLLMTWFGLIGAGMAFLGLYLWHSALIYLLVRHLTGFRLSSANVAAILILSGTAGSTFAATQLLPVASAIMVGAATTVASGVYSLWQLAELMPQMSPLRRIMDRTSLSARRKQKGEA